MNRAEKVRTGAIVEHPVLPTGHNYRKPT